MRIYSSTDAGQTWTTVRAHPPPAKPLATCSSDPGVAIDSKGRQYYSFVRATPCEDGARQYVFVVVRSGPDAAWSKPIRVAALGRARLDDKPAIAVDNSPRSPHRGRVYLAWTRVARNVVFSVVLSHSDNGGRTWSKPVKVNKEGRVLTYASVAVGPKGTVYVAWDDVDEFGIWMARSTNGGKSFRDHRKVASFVAVTIPHCGSGIVIPAQPRTCVNANPIVSVDTSRGPYSGRVYVSYARTEFRGRQAAHIALFDPHAPADRAGSRHARGEARRTDVRRPRRRPVLAAVGRGRVERHGVDVLLRHARRSRAQARVLFVHDLPQRRPDVAPADPRGHRAVGRDGARLPRPLRLPPGRGGLRRRRAPDLDRHARARRLERGDLHDVAARSRLRTRRHHPERGLRFAKSSAISSNVAQRTPSCLLMCSMIRSCMSSTCGRPLTSGWIVIVKTA